MNAASKQYKFIWKSGWSGYGSVYNILKIHDVFEHFLKDPILELKTEVLVISSFYV